MLASGTASELPPFSEVAVAPASHCGIWATRHLPAPASTPDSRLAGIQAPMVSVAMVPLPRPWYHSSLHEPIGASRSSSMSCCHSSANWVEPSSVKSSVTSVPSTAYGCPPACQIMDVVKPASPVSLAM